MAGPPEELVTPDSWEVADLEESVSRLMVSSPSKRDTSALGFVDDPTPADAVDFPPGLPAKELVAQVDQFLREALEKPRERISILRMEQDVVRFIRDRTQHQLEFQALPTSYLRLAAHRVAQHYYLQSIAIPDNSMPDGSGSRIILFKTSECRFPPIRLADIPVNLPQEDNSGVAKVAIKQRPQKYSPPIKSVDGHSSKTNHLKSVEERKEEYNRARARIFSGNSSANATSDDEPSLPEDLQDCHFLTLPKEVKSISELPDSNIGRRSGEPSTASSIRTSRGRTEREPLANRQKFGNRVAIFRDREVDRKDPDYDRSYDRYTQRFDPGFGFSGAAYAIQPMFSPAVNYNTEFPQLSTHRPQITVDSHSRQVASHMCSPWSTLPSPTALGYGSIDGMVTPYRANHAAPQSTSSMYLHSPQYVTSPRPGMTFVRSHEYVPNFVQSHQQQPEPNFGLARPR